MEVLVAVLVALGIWVVSATGRVAALIRRHWLSVIGIGAACIVIGVFALQSQWAQPSSPADYAKGEATMRALIASP